MLEKYHDAMIAAVRMVGESSELIEFVLLYRTSPGGVAGMSTTWSIDDSSLGLLLRRVVHDCASTMGKIGIQLFSLF